MAGPAQPSQKRSSSDHQRVFSIPADLPEASLVSASTRHGARYCTIGDEDVATINGGTAQTANRYLLAEKTWRPPGGLPSEAAL